MKRTLFLLLLALVSMLTLIACGEDEDTNSDSNAAEQAATISVGQPAPYFALPDARGGDVAITEYTEN